MTNEATKSDLVDIEIKLIRETEKAYLVSDGTKKAWIPKSQCELEGGILTLPEPVAIDKELI